MQPGDKASTTMEVTSRMEAWLGGLEDGKLAERIMDAARLAMAKHMQEKARSVMSSVESEDSDTTA